ncbi:hypothetical protein AG1IA_02812 [Rhizoctonia solani AG-1 IA]|uniref:Uncharacterized protein n=1 Tax=Thanatephorus cucumeris (strain AG1-IA) TaxID=983506 RepID=L8X241_THACA|nr:hypothetical protein AG1IA_02812 [Rhizoctonia solani AG-1 IA]
MNHTSSSERTPLLTTVIQNSNPNSQAAQQASSSVETGGDHHGHAAAYNPRVAISSILALLFSLGLVIFGVFYIERLPNDPERAAIKILEKTPLIVSCCDVLCDIKLKGFTERMG